MKLLILIALAALSLTAADRKITWNPDTAELSWIGTTDGKTKYVVNLRTRLMTANGKDAKRFSEVEQYRVFKSMLNLENYTLQSEDWFPDPERWMEQHEQKQMQTKPQVMRASK